MHLFRTHRANVGLSLRADGISLAVLGSGFRKRREIRWLEERTIRPGLLREGPAESNIDQLDELAAEIRAVMRPRWDPAIALSLPDACASMAVFAFQSLPAKVGELDALLRWRFEHEARCAVPDTTIISSVFPIPQSRRGTRPSQQDEPVVAAVLAVAIKRAILQQYQHLCEAAGLFPVSIGVASLQLFDLYRRAMPGTGECFFSTWASDMMVLVALREGAPVYLRSKRVRNASALQAELQSSLQSFDDHYPHGERPIQANPSPLFLVGNALCEPSIGVEEGEIWSPTRDPYWRVQVRRSLSLSHQAMQIPQTLSYGGQCALASTLVA
jgi:hypothetical protein